MDETRKELKLLHSPVPELVDVEPRRVVMDETHHYEPHCGPGVCVFPGLLVRIRAVEAQLVTRDEEIARLLDIIHRADRYAELAQQALGRSDG